MNDSTIKHLELVQAVIARMADNSFKIKSWAVALVSAVLVVAERVAGWQYLFVALVPALVFWGLDAFYLRQEKLFRTLYDAIRLGESAEAEGAFTMNTAPHCNLVGNWFGLWFTRPLIGIYGPIVAIIVALAVLRGWMNIKV